MHLDEFLSRNRIEPEIWRKSGLAWETLEAIAADHDTQRDFLRDSAEIFARVIQRCPTVHSVRWRIKETDHLLEKIIRKRAQGAEKYESIDQSNYYIVVTDLVGLRALHLFKDDCFRINEQFLQYWLPEETPVAYMRAGDPPDLVDQFTTRGFEVKQHPAGYRSIHYVFSTQPMQRKVFAEIQVRTIFEEGWSEIDHRVRYPNFSDNPLVSYFLTIFNRLSGSADEMGTFVQGLTRALTESDSNLALANREKEDALVAMEKMLSELDVLKKKDAAARAKVESLQQEVKKMRRLYSIDERSASERSVIESLVGPSLVERGAWLAGARDQDRVGPEPSLLERVAGLVRPETASEMLASAIVSNSSLRKRIEAAGGADILSRRRSSDE